MAPARLDVLSTELRGAYGCTLVGLAEAEHLLVVADPEWPELEVVVRHGAIDAWQEHVNDVSATLVLLGAAARVERSPGRAEFVFEQKPNIEAVVHPYLAPIAGLVSHWHGRESIHAGGFAVEGNTWGLVGERAGGKSTTLARLALEGVPIVADDVLVVAEGRAFAGPRAIDLRRESAEALGVGTPLGTLGARERWRLGIDQLPGDAPLTGWVFLSWGDDVSIAPLGAVERFRRLLTARIIHLAPMEPEALLALAALPAFELRRPRRWTSLSEATHLLLETLARA